jgi:hypothetical protein
LRSRNRKVWTGKMKTDFVLKLFLFKLSDISRKVFTVFFHSVIKCQNR